MELGTIINNIAAGSATATPNTGSDTLDLITHLPSKLLASLAQIVESAS